MFIFWVKILAVFGILVVTFGFGSSKLRKLIFKGKSEDGQD